MTTAGHQDEEPAVVDADFADGACQSPPFLVAGQPGDHGGAAFVQPSFDALMSALQIAAQNTAAVSCHQSLA